MAPARRETGLATSGRPAVDRRSWSKSPLRDFASFYTVGVVPMLWSDADRRQAMTEKCQTLRVRILYAQNTHYWTMFCRDAPPSVVAALAEVMTAWHQLESQTTASQILDGRPSNPSNP